VNVDGFARRRRFSVEVIDLVLVCPGLEAVYDLINFIALSIPRLDSDMDAASHHAPEVGDG
jgi:hypothetical protein